MKTTKFRIKIILIKICVYLLVFSLLNSIFTGCYSSNVVVKEKFFTESSSNPVNYFAIVINEDASIKIDEVIYQVFAATLVVAEEKPFFESTFNPVNYFIIATNEDKRIKIDKVIYQVIDDTLYVEGINKTNTSVYGQPINVQFSLADIKYVEIYELNTIKTIGCFIGNMAVLALFIAMAVSLSGFTIPIPDRLFD